MDIDVSSGSLTDEETKAQRDEVPCLELEGSVVGNQTVAPVLPTQYTLSRDIIQDHSPNVACVPAVPGTVLVLRHSSAHHWH